MNSLDKQNKKTRKERGGGRGREGKKQSGVCVDPLTLLSDYLPPLPSDMTEGPLCFALRLWFLCPGEAGELVTLGTRGGAGMDTPPADI